MLCLVLNNHTLWPSVSESPPFRIFPSCHQASCIGSNQMQFTDTLYIAYMVVLYILIAICYCKALSPVSTHWIFITSFSGGQGKDMEYLHLTNQETGNREDRYLSTRRSQCSQFQDFGTSEEIMCLRKSPCIRKSLVCLLEKGHCMKKISQIWLIQTC